MSTDNTKSLLNSLTFLSLMALLLFNFIGQDRFDFIFAYTDEIVNAIFTAMAAYGRWRASKKIDSFF